ncbi:MAG: type II secretion system F family protein [Acidimicrobiia bacterium]|nr:type II secretion system F family protein [Acidimicrobiia bacterium]
MPETFKYKVRDRAGALLEGELDADNVSVVAARLRQQGFIPIEIDRKASGGLQSDLKIPGISDRVKLKDLAIFSRQLATMINSGLSLLRALTILTEQTENQSLAKVIGEVRQDVETGSALSVAMAKHPKVFNNLFVSMVRAGETGGILDDVLVRVADTIERQVQLRNKVKSAMTYPIMAMSLILLILAAMLIFIVPQFKNMYDALQGTLPLPTRMLLWASSAFINYGLIIGVPVTVVTIILVRRWAKTEKGRYTVDKFKLKAPLFGKIVHKAALARFSRTLGVLLSAGVPILESLEIVAETVNNVVIGNAIQDVKASVKTGESIARPLTEHEVFPPMVVQMLAVGEETGALDTMLEKIADFYEDEVATAVESLTSLIEPLLIVVMGIAVGGMLISLYMPMFNIINLIK